MTHQDVLEQRGEEWFILSEAGEELEGPFTSREQAAERLRQIEAAKAARGSTDAVPDRKDGDALEVRRYDLHLGELHTDRDRSDGVFMRETKEGFLRGEARFARTGVQTYQDREGNAWGEYRDPGEVFHPDSLRSYDLAVVTHDHPEQFVSRDNVRDVQVGSVGTDAHRDGMFVRASLVVTDAETIRAIKAGKTDLSMGYTSTVVVQRGVTQDGTPYAGKQTNIRINHAAVVDQGRAGPECGVVLARGDAFTLNPVETLMETRIIKLGDQEFTVPVAVADALDAATVTAQDEQVPQDTEDQFPFKKKAKGKGKGAEEEDPEEEDKDSTTALKAKVDTMEAKAATDAETFAARVDARVALVTTARTVLGPETRTDGVGDSDLMRAVVLKVLPNMEARLDANKADTGYLRASYDQAVELHARREEAVQDTHTALFTALNDGPGDVFTDALEASSERAEV
jgi:hypothetical protein